MKQVYEKLGEEIKSLRLVSSETLSDVCDSVEMEVASLRAIEAGQQRPDEDILALILSHFEVEEQLALKIWRLAGYDKSNEGEKKMANSNDKPDDNKLQINIPADKPVLYTDMVQIMSNQYGLVLHFLQLTPSKQATVVSRIGMSKEHAQSLLELLKRNLEDSKD